MRDALRSLCRLKASAGFEAAIHNLSSKIDQAGSAYHDPRFAASAGKPRSPSCAASSPMSHSNDTLSSLSEEVRGLSAKVDRVAASSKTLDAEAMKSLEQRIADLPVLGATGARLC